MKRANIPKTNCGYFIAPQPSSFEPASKAMKTLIGITLILIVVFAYIFSRYEDPEFITRFIENKEKDYLGLGLTVSTLVIVVFGLLFANVTAQKKSEGWGAMKYPQLVFCANVLGKFNDWTLGWSNFSFQPFKST